MERPALGSLLLGSADPERLRAWYRAALEPDDERYGVMRFGGTGLLIDGRGDVDRKNPEPGRVILNFHVADARATAEHLDRLGVSWLVEVEERDTGLFGTLIDPDGNYVQIIQFDEAYLASPADAEGK